MIRDSSLVKPSLLSPKGEVALLASLQILVPGAGFAHTMALSQGCSTAALLTFAAVVLVSKLCLTPCNPMDRSLPGSSVHGILQARILE